MENLLKQLREEANLTQETVADQLGVSVNTIQNWERTGKITKESLHDLLDVYGTDHLTRNRVVLSIFGDTRSPEQKSTVDNFPEFLFNGRPDILSVAKAAVLSADEMELFGYTYYMDGINGSNEEYGYGPRRWPLEYSLFKDYGGYFHTMRFIASIKGRVGEYSSVSSGRDSRSLARSVYNYGLSHPGVAFSLVTMDKGWIMDNIRNLPNLDGTGTDIRSLYDQCKAVEDSFLLGTTDNGCNEYNLPDVIKSIVKVNNSYYQKDNIYELKLDEICSQCIIIDKVESADNDYVMRKEQYLSDRRAYEEHPDLYDREPSFKYEFEYWLRLTDLGKKYINWVES